MTSLKSYCRYVPAALALILAVIVGASFQVNNQATAAMFNPEEPVCVLGWSKDHCNGELIGDNVRAFPCVLSGGDECRTIVVRDASLKFPVRSGLGTCGVTINTPCDEAQALNGTLVLKGDFTFRGNDPCRYRGCWEGEWELYDPTGATLLATGRAGGPLGTGSHRLPSSCTGAQACNPNCERCYEVQYVGTPDSGRWTVDLEGCIDGTVVSGQFTGSEICVTISGVLITPGNSTAPFNFGDWDFCGASDGTLLVPCHKF